MEREGEDEKVDMAFGVVNPEPGTPKPAERVGVVVMEFECDVLMTGNDSEAVRLGVEESIVSMLESDIERRMSGGTSRTESGPV